MKTQITPILTIAFAILTLVACGKKDSDQTLNGLWVGQTSINSKSRTNSTENFVMKFHDADLEIDRIVDGTPTSGQREVETGYYKTDKNVADFKVSYHSCAQQILDGTVSRATEIKFSYVHNKGQNSTSSQSANYAGETLNVTFGPNKVVTFTKLEGSDVASMQSILDQQPTGCYVEQGGNSSKFQRAPVTRLMPRVSAAVQGDDASSAQMSAKLYDLGLEDVPKNIDTESDATFKDDFKN